MNCPNCNTFNVDTATFCASCGMEFEESKQSVSGTNYNGQVKRPQSRTYYRSRPVGARYSNKAVASLIISLLGIFFAGIICGAIGIVLSILAIVEIVKKPIIKGKGIAIFGLLLSVTDCVLMIIFIANGSYIM